MKTPEALDRLKAPKKPFYLDVLLAELNRLIEIIDINSYHRVVPGMPGCLQAFGEKHKIQLNLNSLVKRQSIYQNPRDKKSTVKGKT